jgi:Ca-activated chloride channel homolog
MKDSELSAAFKRLQPPVPDPQARLRAKRAAMAEFARAQAAQAANESLQASRTKQRPSRGTSSGSGSMKWFLNRGWLASAAGVCVVALGLTMVWPNLSRDVTDVGRIVEPATPSERAPQALASGAAADATDVTANEGPGAKVTAPTQDQPPPHASEPAHAPAATQAAAPSFVPEDRVTSAPAEPAPAASAAPSAAGAGQAEEVVVSGLRATLQQSAEAKREANSVVDAISAEDIGQFPDHDAAESLQRIPGVSVSRNPGNGRTSSKPESRDRFRTFESHSIRRVIQEPVSTFSADVDTASYSFVRGQLSAGRLPQKDAVRSEEMINYFDYEWPAATSRQEPFRPTIVVSESPWNPGRKLVHIGIKALDITGEAPDANLVLLLDVSGSMDEPNKLPLAVRSMELLLDSLKPTDTLGIVVYAGAAGTVLEPTPVRDREKIVEALRSLRPGGSTAGAEGIERAYELAERHFRKGGVNRILLATDGDFNVGIADTAQLKGFVERKREGGVYLSVLGFGQGNYRDELAQALAQNGNGVAAYIDSESEARKVLVEQARGTLFTVAKDVKLQVEFNPETVSEYRLVGYETRALRREDFNNDKVDAGDVGAGHTVTAIYEITPMGAAGAIDEPRYEGNRPAVRGREIRGGRAEFGFLKIRYKLPGESRSRLLTEPIPLRSAEPPASVARDVSFSTAVAGFAQLLRGSGDTGSLTFEDVLRQAQASRGEDRFGRRAEFIDLVRKAQSARGM